MTKRKNWIKLVSYLIFSVILPILLIEFSIIDISKIIALGNDFHYNVISLSAISAGFLFTGISILISTLEKKRIERLWKNNYLDNLYRAAIIGIIFNILTVITSIVILICKIGTQIYRILVYFELILLIASLLFFIWCLIKLISLISKLKESNN